ncbi:hypothetical protein [Methylobacterium oxalidis]
MFAARSLRRLLALLAVLLPLDAARPDLGSEDRTTAETEEVRVVFRHFV